MNELLSIGTVIKCKYYEYPVVIVGYGGKSKTKIDFDYMAYAYPLGLIKKELLLGVKVDSIEEILYDGYKDEKYYEMISKLKGGLKNE